MLLALPVSSSIKGNKFSAERPRLKSVTSIEGDLTNQMSLYLVTFTVFTVVERNQARSTKVSIRNINSQQPDAVLILNVGFQDVYRFISPTMQIMIIVGEQFHTPMYICVY